MTPLHRLLPIVLLTPLVGASVNLQPVAAHHSPSHQPVERLANHSTPASDRIEVVGVIRYTPIEGGCYRLETTDNRQFQLLGNFPRQDGARVRVKGRLLRDVGTICQIGQPLQVESIQAIEPTSTEGLPKNAIFRATTTGGIAGITTETTLFRNGRIEQTSSRGAASQPKTCRVPSWHARLFQFLVDSKSFAHLQGQHYPAPNGAADFFTIRFTSQSGTVSYDDVGQTNRLPQSLQNVIQAWQRVSRCT